MLVKGARRDQFHASWLLAINIITQITKSMGPTWGPPGSCQPQMGPCWPHEPCYQGKKGRTWNYSTISQLQQWLNRHLDMQDSSQCFIFNRSINTNVQGTTVKLSDNICYNVQQSLFKLCMTYVHEIWFTMKMSKLCPKGYCSKRNSQFL